LPGLITVARVQIPADLRQASVWVSLLQINPDELQLDSKDKTQQKALKKAVGILQHWAPDIQDEIGNKLQLKYLPKLTFFPDESTEKILKIEKIISQVSKDSSKDQSKTNDNTEDDEN
jgi:ribosome-binding factor A